MKPLFHFLLWVSLQSAVLSNEEVRSQSIGSEKWCQDLCKRNLSSKKAKNSALLSCHEICLQKGTRNLKQLHRSRRGVDKRNDQVVYNTTHCPGKSNLKIVAKNVQVKYCKDTAFVSWEEPSDLPSNSTWDGYAIRWHTNEGFSPIQFCKFYFKNQTCAIIRHGHGWNSSRYLYLNVVLIPDDPTFGFTFIRFPFPKDSQTRERTCSYQHGCPTRKHSSKGNLLPVAIGGALGAAVLIALVVILTWCFRFNSDKDSSYGMCPENDVFITYSRKDEDYVSEKLVPLLDEYHIRYQIDYIDFEPGVPWMENLTNCIQNSHKVLIVMSSTYLESINCKKELQEALNINKLSSLILLRIDSVSKEKFPKAIRDRTFIDYYSELERKYWKDRVIEAVRSTNNNRLGRFLSRSLSRDTQTSII